MLNLGASPVKVLSDNWTVVTWCVVAVAIAFLSFVCLPSHLLMFRFSDGSLSAQAEDIVLITDTGCEVLTKHTNPFSLSSARSPKPPT
jgi:hypothetical protein